MLTRTLAVLFFAFAANVSWANPLIATHPVYMTSEQLQVKLLNDAVEIDGRFHFRSLVKAETKSGGPADSAPVSLQVTIRAPWNQLEADAATLEMLRALKASEFNEWNESNRAAWDAAVGLKVSVGDLALKTRRVALFDPLKKEHQERIPAEWFRQGYYTILVDAEFDPKLLAADPEIRIQYRQGLRQSRTGAEFFYLPMFWGTPPEHTTRDLREFAMFLTNASGRPASLGTVTVPIGYSIVLPLAHHEPITVRLKATE